MASTRRELSSRRRERPRRPTRARAGKRPRAPRVLVVGHEAPNRRLIKTALLHSGYEVAEASRRDLALARVRRESFNIIVVDISGTKGDGYEVLDGLHRLPSFSTPVITVSENDDPAGCMTEVALGAIDRVRMPFDDSALVTTVEQVLALPAQERERRIRMLERAALVYAAVTRLRDNGDRDWPARGEPTAISKRRRSAS